MIGKSPRTRNMRPIRQSLPVTFKGLRIVGRSRSYFVGFHSRAIRCASAIWSGVIFLATSSRISAFIFARTSSGPTPHSRQGRRGCARPPN